MANPDISEWLDMMGDTITVFAFVSRSVSGQPTYSPTGVPYPAYINMKNHLVTNRAGQTVTARGYAIIGTSDVIGIEDKIVLPSEYVPTSPPLIDVNVETDEDGNHHTRLDF